MRPESAGEQRPHVFSVDVEEFFQVNAFESTVTRDDWASFDSRLDVGMDALLQLLSDANAHGTFFTLGWVADRRPDIVRRIVAEGHELASHGYWHRRVVTQSPADFREDIRRAKQSLENAAGTAVLGYRAPSFSIIRESEWALDVLSEEGYRYDSSRFPIYRRGYGSPHVPLNAHVIQTAAHKLLELPLTVLEIGRARFPAAGGGWFRQFPEGLVASAFRQREERGASGMFYIHPWELDPEQPRLPVSWLTSIRHYRGLGVTRDRIARLLRAFRFTSVHRAYADEIAALLT